MNFEPFWGETLCLISTKRYSRDFATGMALREEHLVQQACVTDEKQTQKQSHFSMYLVAFFSLTLNPPFSVQEIKFKTQFEIIPLLGFNTRMGLSICNY